MALAGAVRTEDRDAFAVPDLGRERVGEAVQFELLDGQGALAGALTAEVDVDPLLADLCRLVVPLVELAEPALGSLQSWREHLADLGPSAHLGHKLFELAALLFVDGQVVLASGEVGVAGVVIARESSAVRPRTLGLDGDHLRRRHREQLAVVADEQHRLRCAA